MKRISLTLFVTLFTMVSFAGGIKVSQGKVSYIKNERTVAVVFNWENAKWDMGTSVKEEWGDNYQSYVDNGESEFIEGFNKSCKKVKMVKDESSANYIMTVEFTNFDKFYSVMSLVPGNKHKIWAEITVTDKDSGEIICKYNVNEFKGGRDFSIFDSYKEAMRDFGYELARIK